MNWFVLATISAFGAAATRLIIKCIPDERTETVLFSRYFFAMFPGLLLLSFFGVPEIKWSFYPAALIACAADVVAIRFMISSLAASDMSRTVPLLALTPVFVLMTGFILLGETPSKAGLAGVFLVVAGSYALNASFRQSGIFVPFKLLFDHRGARHMLLTAFLFSIATPCFKITVLSSSPVFAMAFTICLSAAMVFAYSKLRGAPVSFPRRSPRLAVLVLLGLSLFVVALAVNYALETGMTSYVISVKRLSILFSALLGVIVLRESRGLQNVLSGSIMVAGAVIIALSSASH